MYTELFAGAVFALALPIGLTVWWKKKTGAKLWCFAAGAICFFVFVSVLEGLLHQVCLVGDNSVSRVIKASPVLYTLYGALAAGIFEETGRLFGFKVLLKKYDEKECAIAYGIGHGGIEVLLVLGATYIVYLLAAMGISIGSAEATAQIAGAAENITISMVILAMFERISAMLVHIGLSMIMFTAVKKTGNMWLYPVSICLHALADVFPCLYQYGLIKSIILIEVVIFVFGIALFIAGKKILEENFAGDEVLEAG